MLPSEMDRENRELKLMAGEQVFKERRFLRGGYGAESQPDEAAVRFGVEVVRFNADRAEVLVFDTERTSGDDVLNEDAYCPTLALDNRAVISVARRGTEAVKHSRR